MLTGRLLHLHEHLVGDHHCARAPTLSITAHAHVEERVVHRGAHRVVVVALGLPPMSTVLVSRLRLLLSAYRLLAAITGRLLLAALQIESKVGGRAISCRLHAHLLRLTHLIILRIFDDLCLMMLLLVLLVLLATGRLRLVIWLMNRRNFPGGVADVVSGTSVEVYLFMVVVDHGLRRGGYLTGHIKLVLAGLLA